MSRVVALMIVVLALFIAPPAFGYANPDSNGNAQNAPGQEGATVNCERAFNSQGDRGVIPPNGAHAGEAPANCDHFFQ